MANDFLKRLQDANVRINTRRPEPGLVEFAKMDGRRTDSIKSANTHRQKGNQNPSTPKSTYLDIALVEGAKRKYDLEQLAGRDINGEKMSKVSERIKEYKPIIKKASKQYNIPEDLIESIIAKESSGFPDRHNQSSGARGLMQVVPASAGRDIGAPMIDEYYDNPENNIMAGTKYLKKIFNDYLPKFYKGMPKEEMTTDNPQAIEAAFRAYNWGIGNLNKPHLPKETKDYITTTKEYRDYLNMLKEESAPIEVGMDKAWREAD